ncbi:MAG: nucleotidyltransferase family protein, partial [Zavarzinella sp.]|nr:nucleotidyltransferase family protein [Zavarzinella sp.]
TRQVVGSAAAPQSLRDRSTHPTKLQSMTFAVVPAAGQSTRMGRPKLSLRLGDRTVLEHVVAALRAGGVDHVVVVIGPHVSDLALPATLAGADVHLLPEQTPDMRTTVERGLLWLEEQYRPRPDDFWLLAPADHPMLNPAVVRQLLETGTGDRSIVVPVHGGRRGHPTLIGWRHVAGIRSLRPGVGINAYILDHNVFEVPVTDPSVLADLDTPEDWARIRAAAEGSPLPRSGREGE